MNGVRESVRSGTITSFEDFTSWCNEDIRKRSTAWSRFGSLQDRLENSDNEIKDPIKFLYDLYFNQNYSLRKIRSHPIVSDCNFNYSVKGLRNLLGITFGWPLRKNTETTPAHSKIAEKKVTEGVIYFTQRVERLLSGGSDERKFNIQEYQSKKYKIQKTLYVLESLGGIDANIILKIHGNGDIGARIITNGLNHKLQELISSNPNLGLVYEDLKLSSSAVDKWLKNKSCTTK